MASTSQKRIRLESLSIRDFRGIETLDLQFTNKKGTLNRVVIGGVNGCGKTSVLEAIVMLLTGTDAALASDKPTWGEQVRFGASHAQVSGQALVHGEKRSPSFSLLRSGASVETHLWGYPVFPDYNWGHAAFPSEPPSIEYFSSRRDPTGLGRTPDPRARQAEGETSRLSELKRRLVSAYYRGLRKGAASAYTTDGPFARLQSVWSRFDHADRTIDVIPMSNDEGSGEEVVLRERRPIPADITSLEMARRLAVERTDIPFMVPLDRLSSGQIALLTFASPLIFRDLPADLILIDEPEQHLHSGWQRILLDAVQELSPESQLVVATHSDEILASAPSFERFILVDPKSRSVGSSAAE